MKFMDLMRNLVKGFGILMPLMPYLFLGFTLAFGGTFIYEKITDFVKSSNDVLTSTFKRQLDDLADEQRRIYDGIQEYVTTSERELSKLDRNLQERQRTLEERERNLASGEQYLQERFRELGKLNEESDYLDRLTDELFRRYYNGELEISIYDYVEKE